MQLPQNGKVTSALLVALLMALMWANAARAYDERVLSEASSGWIEGVVRIDRDVAPRALPAAAERAGCGGDPRPGGGIEATERGVRDVAVYLDEVSAGVPLPTRPVVIDQRGCRFVPRVFGLVAGQPLVVRNSDDVLHNVTASLGGQPLFRLAMPIQGQELWKKPLLLQDGQPLGRGLVRFHCEAGHTWMEAFAIVLPHPYLTVSDVAGAFRLERVPPGTYKLVFWHPVLGEHRESVTVQAREGVEVDLTLPLPAEP